jgi:hypothetical protein
MFFKILSTLGLAGLAVSAPLLERSQYNVGHLSHNPPPKGFGQGQYGSYQGFQVKNVNDVNILQFALMLEVNHQHFMG